MIEQQGRVIALRGEDAVIRIGGRSGCAACDAGKGCGAGIFGRLLMRNPVSVEVRNHIGAGIGQAVEVGIAEERFLALVGRLYVVPLLIGLVGAVAGFLVGGALGLAGLASDAVTLTGAILAAAVALSWVRRGLREFPMHDAVHLVRDLGQRDCGASSGPQSEILDEPGHTEFTKR